MKTGIVILSTLAAFSIAANVAMFTQVNRAKAINIQRASFVSFLAQAEQSGLNSIEDITAIGLGPSTEILSVDASTDSAIISTAFNQTVTVLLNDGKLYVRHW